MSIYNNNLMASRKVPSTYRMAALDIVKSYNAATKPKEAPKSDASKEMPKALQYWLDLDLKVTELTIEQLDDKLALLSDQFVDYKDTLDKIAIKIEAYEDYIYSLEEQDEQTNA